MPILGMLIKPVYIYAGKLKTPETGKYKANKAYTAEPCIKVCSSDREQLHGSAGSKRKQAETDRPNTGHHAGNDRRKQTSDGKTAGTYKP
jgi:hypothetical protein